MQHLAEREFVEEDEVFGESLSVNLFTIPTPTELGYNCGENLVTNHLSYGLALAHQLTF